MSFACWPIRYKTKLKQNTVYRPVYLNFLNPSVKLIQQLAVIPIWMGNTPFLENVFPGLR